MLFNYFYEFTLKDKITVLDNTMHGIRVQIYVEETILCESYLYRILMKFNSSNINTEDLWKVMRKQFSLGVRILQNVKKLI